MMHSPLSGLFDSLYRGPEDLSQWSELVLERANDAFPSNAGVGLTITTTHATGPVSLASFAHRAPNAGFHFLTDLSPEGYSALYYPQARVGLISQLAPSAPPDVRERSDEYLRLAGARDVLGLIGHPAVGFTVVFYTPVTMTVITAAQRVQLDRLRLHLENALRLRMRAAAPAAVFTRDGKLDMLSVQESGSLHPHLDWAALVSGEWSVTEQIDGRHYLVFANSQLIRSHRALSPQEQLALEAFMAGDGGKEAAASIGITQAGASQLKHRIASKLGFREPLDAIRFARVVRDGHATAFKIDAISRFKLSAAERAVLRLVEAGDSLPSIARQRAASLNTVRNQVASIRRKLGRTSPLEVRGSNVSH